jgi:hypothetical protein
MPHVQRCGNFWFKPRDQISIAKDLTIEAPQDALIPWSGLHDIGEKLSFLTQVVKR